MNHKTDKTLNRAEMSGRGKSIREGKRPAVTRTGKRNGEIRTEDCLGITKNVTHPNIRF